MLLFPRFFYEEGGSADGGGASDANQSASTPAIPEDIQKELNELRAFREANKQPAQKTPEEISRETETRKADFIKFSVDEQLLKMDDISKHDTIIGKADRDLVYDSWFANWKEENPTVDEADIAELAKKEFDDEFKLSSTNEKAKTRGEARLKKEADEIRSPLVTNYKTAQTQFDAYQTAKTVYPKFQKAVDDLVNESVPEELFYKTKEKNKDGVEEEVSIPTNKLTAEDKQEIAKLFKTQKYFTEFLQKNSDPAALKEAIATKIERLLVTKYQKQREDTIFEKAKGIGLAQGSNVGSKNHFGLTGNNAGQEGAVIIPIDNAKANAAAEKIRNSKR